MLSDHLRCFISIILSIDTLIYGLPLSTPQQIAQVPFDAADQLQGRHDLAKTTAPTDVNLKTPVKAINAKEEVNHSGPKNELLEPGITEKRLRDGNGDQTSNQQKQISMTEVKAMENNVKTVNFPSESKQNIQASIEPNPAAVVGSSAILPPAVTVSDSMQAKTLQAVQNPVIPPSHLETESIEPHVESKSETSKAEPRSAKLVNVQENFDFVQDHQSVNAKLTELNPENNISNKNTNPAPSSVKSNSISTAADTVDELLNHQKLATLPTSILASANHVIASDKTKKVYTTPTIETPETAMKMKGNLNAQDEKPRVPTQMADESKKSDENNFEKSPVDDILHSKKYMDNPLTSVSDWKPFTLNHELIGFKGLRDSVIHNDNVNKFGHTQAHQSGLDGVALEYMLMVLCVVLIIILLVWRRFWYAICTTCFPRSNSTESPSVAYKVGYRPLINRSQ